MKRRFQNILSWLDNNILFILATFLLLLIPLWPKIPLADLIPGYIVRLRLEDIVVLITFIIYLIWVWRGKISWKMPTWQLIFACIALGAMSILSGVLVLETIPLEGMVHLSKAVLHWARYIEYFFLSFLFFSTLKTKKQVKIVLASILIVVSSISIYGMGQKYLYWPLYSTMNREFSKGMRLYLTPHARVQSTFGGHYDFAAYLVLMLPLTLVIAWHAPKKWQRALAWLTHILGLWAIIASAARTSILAYFAAATVLFAINIFANKKLKLGAKIGRFIGQQFFYYCLVGLLIFNFGQDMIERFEQSLNSIEVLKVNYERFKAFRGQMTAMFHLEGIEPPTNSVAVNVDNYGNNVAVTAGTAGSNVLTPTDSRPTDNKPADVYVDVPDIKYRQNEQGEMEAYEATRTWSVNAEKYGLSMAIRFDTLWPNALRALARNPLLGSGYGTINKGDQLNLFTEADSTDNNYLRILGETGLLGFFTFYGSIILTLIVAIKQLKNPTNQGLRRWYGYGFIAATVGILINALYIDVFSASKVAFSFWMLYGIFWASQKLEKQKN